MKTVGHSPRNLLLLQNFSPLGHVPGRLLALLKSLFLHTFWIILFLIYSFSEVCSSLETTMILKLSQSDTSAHSFLRDFYLCTSNP